MYGNCSKLLMKEQDFPHSQFADDGVFKKWQQTLRGTAIIASISVCVRIRKHRSSGNEAGGTVGKHLDQSRQRVIFMVLMVLQYFIPQAFPGHQISKDIQVNGAHDESSFLCILQQGVHAMPTTMWYALPDPQLDSNDNAHLGYVLNKCRNRERKKKKRRITYIISNDDDDDKRLLILISETMHLENIGWTIDIISGSTILKQVDNRSKMNTFFI